MIGSERNNVHFHESEHEILSPEEFWAKQEQSIQEWALNIVQDSEYYSEEERIEQQNKLVESEKKFTLNIIEEFKALLEKNKSEENPIILWDVDETIAKNVFVDKSEFNTIFRPSAIGLMKHLSDLAKSFGVTLEQGLLTSRGKLEEQLQETNRLAPISELVSIDLLYSDRDVDIPYIPNEAKQIEYFSEKLSELLDHESVVALVRSGYVQGDFTKLVKLSQIKSEKPNTPIMAIDDMLYPTILSRDKNMFGVSLRKGGYFSLP